MTPKLTANVSLAVGAVFSCAMGAYHFFLPSQFHWSASLRTVPQPIPWALFSINFFFSFLLLAGGILTFIALMEFHRSSHCDRGILTAHGGVLADELALSGTPPDASALKTPAAQRRVARVRSGDHARVCSSLLAIRVVNGTER